MSANSLHLQQTFLFAKDSGQRGGDRQAINALTGEWTEDDVLKKVQESFKPTLEELYQMALEDAFDDAVSSLSGPVEDTDINARIERIIDNALRVAASAYEEKKRLEMVIKEMEEKKLRTAGEALASLKARTDLVGVPTTQNPKWVGGAQRFSRLRIFYRATTMRSFLLLRAHGGPVRVRRKQRNFDLNWH